MDQLVKEEDGRWLLSAEVIGNGAEMWLRGQKEIKWLESKCT